MLPAPLDDDGDHRHDCLEPFKAPCPPPPPPPPPSPQHEPCCEYPPCTPYRPPCCPDGFCYSPYDHPRCSKFLQPAAAAAAAAPPPPSPPTTEIKLFTSDLNVDRSSIVEGVGSVHVDGDATLDGQVTNQGALSVVVNGSLSIGTIGELQAETLIVDVDELELRGRLVARGTVATGAPPLAAGGIDCETKGEAGYQLSVLANVSVHRRARHCRGRGGARVRCRRLSDRGELLAAQFGHGANEGEGHGTQILPSKGADVGAGSGAGRMAASAGRRLRTGTSAVPTAAPPTTRCGTGAGGERRRRRRRRRRRHRPREGRIARDGTGLEAQRERRRRAGRGRGYDEWRLRRWVGRFGARGGGGDHRG